MKNKQRIHKTENPHLDLLSSVNRWLQSKNLTLHTVYCKIQALYKSFIEPVVLNNSKSISDKSNLKRMEDAVLNFPGSDFRQHLSDCTNHSLLSIRQIKAAQKNMYNYIISVGKALERRFPDMDFVIGNTAFLDPSLRKLQQPDMQALVSKFPFEVDASILSSQHRLYQNDSALDFQYELCSKDYVKFWCSLYKEEEYKRLASMALLLLVVSPTTVVCERGFSVRNYVKNEFCFLHATEFKCLHGYCYD